MNKGQAGVHLPCRVLQGAAPWLSCLPVILHHYNNYLTAYTDLDKVLHLELSPELHAGPAAFHAVAGQRSSMTCDASLQQAQRQHSQQQMWLEQGCSWKRVLLAPICHVYASVLCV